MEIIICLLNRVHYVFKLLLKVDIHKIKIIIYLRFNLKDYQSQLIFRNKSIKYESLC